MRRFVYYNSSFTENLLLDLYPGAEVAYSLVKLRRAYNGPTIRVRRDSDNTELDIGFDGTELDVISLLNFVGTGSGFVTTWYDQVLNLDMTQTEASRQYKIVNNGIIELSNGKPTIRTSSNISRMIIGNLSYLTVGEMFMVVQAMAQDNNRSWKLGTSGLNNHYLYTNGNTYDDFGNDVRRQMIGTTNLLNQNIFNALSNTNDHRFWFNFESVFSSSTNNVGFNNNATIGSHNADYTKDKKISELIIYPEDKGILRDEIKQNRIDYYGI